MKGEIIMSRLKKQFALVVDGRELATILAALRFHQDENLRAGPEILDRAILDIATDSGSLKPLNFKDVDRLCERINTCYAMPTRRQKEDWVVVVTDKCRVVHVRTYTSKTAAKEGLFKYLREFRDYDGSEDLRAVRQWVSNRKELLGVDIVQQDI
jgi:hypothetical protein